MFSQCLHTSLSLSWTHSSVKDKIQCQNFNFYLSQSSKDAQYKSFCILLSIRKKMKYAFFLVFSLCIFCLSFCGEYFFLVRSCPLMTSHINWYCLTLTHVVLLFSIASPPLNIIIFGQHKSDKNHGMITLTGGIVYCYGNIWPVISDYNRRLILLPGVQLSDGHCIVKK